MGDGNGGSLGLRSILGLFTAGALLVSAGVAVGTWIKQGDESAEQIQELQSDVGEVRDTLAEHDRRIYRIRCRIEPECGREWQ